MKKIILLLFLSSSVSQAQLFGGWILPSNEQPCFTGTGDGSSLSNTAWSCKHIKDNFPTIPDGLYYLDIDGAGPELPFRGYCDMTRDGGGWLLIGKSKFTALGPSKVEMTGDVTLNGLTNDPWSGGVLPPTSSGYTQTYNFTTPTATNLYLPLGYNGDALQSPSDDLSTTAPNDLYAILSRNLIEAYRTNPCINGDRTKAIMKYNRPPNSTYTSDVSIYIQTSKRFNPIQHKCASSSSVCTGSNLTGCATDFITNYYTTYNTSHTVTGLMSLGISTNWKDVCSVNYANGTHLQGVLPSAWAANTSTFYDLSNTDSSTSGGVIDDGVTPGTFLHFLCTVNTTCAFKLLWIK